MSAVLTAPTPEDLLSMPDGDKFELVNGNLVERDMGLLSCYVGGKVYRKLDEYAEETGRGWAFSADASYQCFRDPNQVRRPDASFIERARLPVERIVDGHCRIVPDLALEVTSANDLIEALDEKIQEYLDAGVRLVWAVHTKTRMVHVYRPDGTGTIIGPNAELTGEDVLPGFRCIVKDLFPKQEVVNGVAQ